MRTQKIVLSLSLMVSMNFLQAMDSSLPSIPGWHHIVHALIPLVNQATQALDDYAVNYDLLGASAHAHGEWFIERALQRSSTNVNVKDSDGRTPLMVAAYHNRVNAVQLLLAHPNTDVNAKDNEKKTPLMITGQYMYDHAQEETRQRLLGNPLSNTLSDEEKAALKTTEEVKQRAIVQLLLADPRTDINATIDSNFSAFMEAAYTGQTEIIKALLADPRTHLNAQAEGGETALMFACRSFLLKRSHPAVVRLLLADHRIDSAIVDDHNETAFSMAVRKDDAEVVREFLASDRITPEEINTALRQPYILSQLGVLELLAHDKRINVSHPDSIGTLLLARAAHEEKISALKILLNAGAHDTDNSILIKARIKAAEGEVQWQEIIAILIEHQDAEIMVKPACS